MAKQAMENLKRKFWRVKMMKKLEKNLDDHGKRSKKDGDEW